MSTLEDYQALIRRNAKSLIGIDVPVVLSEEENKKTALKYSFGWSIDIGVSKHSHSSYCPSGDNYLFCGSGQEASDRARSKAKTYLRGEDSLFNNRMKERLYSDVARNFILGDQDLRSAPSQYVGKDTCHGCRGSGSNSCYSCRGSGQSSCSSCGGSGRREVQRYSNSRERTVYSTESCNTCWGSGKNRCNTCNGSGDITCGTCSGGGYLYCSYSIDGSAIRTTHWSYENSDYHAWSDAFIKSQALSVIYCLTGVEEVSVEGKPNGGTFYYGMKAILPTLQFKADVKGGSTYIRYAGKNEQCHDAGGVYDPAVWNLGKHLGAGDKKTDTDLLAVPAIKSMIYCHTTKRPLDFIDQNWISTDIRDAVVANYQELVRQLKKSSKKGLLTQMFTGLCKNTYLLVMYAFFVALLIPGFADDIHDRFGLGDHLNLIEAFYKGYYAQQWVSIGVGFLFFCLMYKGVSKFYWKRIGKFKKFIIASIISFASTFAVLTTYTAMMNVMRYDFNFKALFLGGSVFVCIYFLFWSFAKPKKWYIKLLAAMGALALIFVLQSVLMYLNGPINIEAIKAGNIAYFDQLERILNPALRYTYFNRFEIFWMAILFTYFATRRRFWIKAKSTVSEYNSPMLLRSLGIE